MLMAAPRAAVALAETRRLSERRRPRRTCSCGAFALQSVVHGLPAAGIAVAPSAALWRVRVRAAATSAAAGDALAPLFEE
jgi:hypothetical protein